jgi:hypothetical protein
MSVLSSDRSSVRSGTYHPAVPPKRLKNHSHDRFPGPSRATYKKQKRNLRMRTPATEPHSERQIFVSARGYRALIVRVLALALLLPAGAWTIGLVLGGTGAAVLPPLRVSRVVNPDLRSLKLRSISFKRASRDRRVKLAARAVHVDRQNRSKL